MTLNVGIVGFASFYGPAYADRAANHPRCDVDVATALGTTDEALRDLSRPTRRKFAAEYDCDVVDSVGDLLDAAPDVVVVASPTTRRAADALTVLRADVPILLAKPAADSHDGAREIADESDERDIPAMMTTPSRFDDAVAELGRRVHGGAVGGIVAVRAAIRHDRVPRAGIDANAEHAPSEAGSTYAMSVYTADALCWLVDTDPVRTHAEYANLNTPHSAHPDIGHASVRFEDGSVGSMTMTYASDCRDPLGNWEVEVVGTEGTLRTSQHGYEGFHWHGGDSENRRVEAFGRSHSLILDRQFDAFVDSVTAGDRGRAPPPGDVADAFALCEAWRRSADGQRPIWFDQWPPAVLD